MLSVREVTTAYQGLVAISAISIEVQKGEIVCVAGANGAGKSTLLKSIAGAERPRSGTVTFDGKRLDGMAQHHITATGIAYVPENRRLFPRLSVRATICALAAISIAATPIVRARSISSSSCSRACPNASISGPKPSPAASSRCSRSAAR
ncbi:ABC-type branched-subunit amino acid transport system ATPase component [Bradyrhizobium sp. LM4.3]